MPRQQLTRNGPVEDVPFHNTRAAARYFADLVQLGNAVHVAADTYGYAMVCTVDHGHAEFMELGSRAFYCEG